MNEDQRMAQRQEWHDNERLARMKTDAIVDARHDLITEVKTLRRLETNGHIDDALWWNALYSIRDITDRLNELEGDTA